MISSGQTTIGSATPVQIDGASASASILHIANIANIDNTKTMYLGGANVTTSTGLPLFKLERLTIDMQPGEQLFAISSDTGHTVAWLRQVL